MKSKSVLFLALLSLIPMPKADAWVFMPGRCEFDSLTPEQAVERNAWFKKCDPDTYERLYNDDSEQNVGGYHADRRMYVTFGKFESRGKYTFPGNWLAPIDHTKDCKLPDSYEFIGVCTSGCFLPATRIAFENEIEMIISAKNREAKEVVTLAANATVENPSYEMSAINGFTSDFKSAEQHMVTFTYLIDYNPSYLTVTLEHPLVDWSGAVRRAQDFKPGDLLVGRDGKPVKIEYVSRHSYFGKVHNLWLDRKTSAENIVVAENVLSGTMYHQAGAGTSEINQQILREKIPANLLK